MVSRYYLYICIYFWKFSDLSRTTMLSAIKYTFSSYYIRRLIRLIRRKSGYFRENRYWLNTSLTWTCNVLRILPFYCVLLRSEKVGSLQSIYILQGSPWQSGYFKLTGTSTKIQVRFCLKVVLKFWDSQMCKFTIYYS